MLAPSWIHKGFGRLCYVLWGSDCVLVEGSKPNENSLRSTLRHEVPSSSQEAYQVDMHQTRPETSTNCGNFASGHEIQRALHSPHDCSDGHRLQRRRVSRRRKKSEVMNATVQEPIWNATDPQVVCCMCSIRPRNSSLLNNQFSLSLYSMTPGNY